MEEGREPATGIGALRGNGRLYPAVAASAVLFCVIATLNAGGYRYGVSDQAFYLAAVLHDLEPGLFPRDAILLEAQDGLMVFDEVAAGVSRLSGLSVPTLFLGGYVLGLLLLWTAATLLGTSFYRSWWTVTALTAALALRHRITRTGVNTLEGYLHPRILAFGLGALAVVAFLRGRTWGAAVLVAAAAVLHPTTALWFALWLAVALCVERPRMRPALLAGGAAAAIAGAWALWFGPLRGRGIEMDPAWVTAIAGKDYVFPTDWPASAWLVNLAYPVVIAVVYRYRRRAGVTREGEAGLVAGALALAGVFLLALPFIAQRVALAVQLQVSRVFWMLDLFATVYVLWLLMESAGARPALRRAVCIGLVAAASLRGGYVMFAEHPGRPFVDVDLPDTEWEDAMEWLQQTPVRSHVLADPGHAWRYGTSVRVAGERDVLLEEVKDRAVAMYSREVALRVVRRTRDIGDFARLTPDRARALARTYDLDYLITERPLALPVAYRNARFIIYALR